MISCQRIRSTLEDVPCCNTNSRKSINNSITNCNTSSTTTSTTTCTCNTSTGPSFGKCAIVIIPLGICPEFSFCNFFCCFRLRFCCMYQPEINYFIFSTGQCQKIDPEKETFEINSLFESINQKYFPTHSS